MRDSSPVTIREAFSNLKIEIPRTRQKDFTQSFAGEYFGKESL